MREFLILEKSEQSIEQRKASTLDRIHAMQGELVGLTHQLNAVRDQIAREYNSIEHLQKAVATANRSLLLEDWRSMTGVSFESWVEQVFSNLGAVVSSTPTTGDQGIDVLADFLGKSYAIQVKGYPNTSVGNGAVQEAHTGAAYYRVPNAVVVTNSRFTRLATELAERIGCLLIDVESIEALALGRHEAFPPYRKA